MMRCNAVVLVALLAPLARAGGLLSFGSLSQASSDWKGFGRKQGAAALQSLENAADLSKPFDKPWFCHGLECPKYTVLNKSDIYETRRYEAGTWAATKVEGLLYTPSVTQGFKRLFDYIGGENKDNLKIDMTAPVLVAVEPGQGPFCKSNFTVAFFMDPKLESKPPTPTSPLVQVIKYPNEIVYAYQFGGYLVDDLTLAAKVKTLKNALTADGLHFNLRTFFTASYDPPTRVTGRHNEILLQAQVITR